MSFPNAYLYDTVDGTRLEFQFIPTDGGEFKAAKYHEHEILGRSGPILAYQGSDARTVGLTLQFFALPVAADDLWTPLYIKEKVNWLKSLVWPDYDNFVSPPHTVRLRLGDAMAIYLGVVTDYHVSTPNNVWENARSGPGLAHGFTVKLNIKEVEGVPSGLSEIRSGGFGALGARGF